MLHTILFIAQAQEGYEQTEYMVAIALTAAMVVLGLIAVCVPRLRTKHFVKPEETEEGTKKGLKNKRR